MSLIKRNFPGIGNLTTFFDDDWMKSRFMTDEWMPAVNVIDGEREYTIELAVPGIPKDYFNVELLDAMLRVSATIENENSETNPHYTRREFTCRSFTREFTLPPNVNDKEVRADYVDGVLKLHLTKTAERTPPKRIIEVM